MLGASDIAGISGLMRSAAVDASAGHRATTQGARAAEEARFERLDSVLLRRLRNLQVRDAATQVTHASDARELVARTRELLLSDPATGLSVHADQHRERLIELLRDHGIE